MDEGKKHFNPNPVTKANCFSRLFFCWLNPIFEIGSKRNLEINDVYNVLEEDSSKYVTDKLEKNWERELQRSRQGKLPSLRRALANTFGWRYALWGCVMLIEEAFLVIQPLFLGGLIRYFSPSSNMELWEGCLYATGISLSALLPLFSHHQYFLAVTRYGMWLRISASALVYKKCLRLSSGSLSKTTTGQIVNLLSNDVIRFDQSLLMLHFLIIGPLQAIVICTILFYFIGWSMLAGLALVVMFIPSSLLLSRIFIRLRGKTAVHTDERVRLMNEVLNAMRIVKMYCWEAVFEECISEARRKEARRILKASYARVAAIAPFFFSGKTIAYFTFLVYILTDHKLSAEIVFVTLGLYNPLRLTMTFFFPLAIQVGSETLVTIRRLQAFLLLEEMDLSIVPFLPLTDGGVPRASVVDIEASWDMSPERSVFKKLSFEVGAGELLAVVGPVGVGKTSLLLAMLGELPLLSGNIQISGKVAYISQQAWVFSASVRQNITFGLDLNVEKYNKVIRAAALTKDLAAMPEGDQTLVGERGVSLSGGQKARISLARALYYDADVYLLDDPLSAVDAKVSNHIFHKCICGILREKPRILVTHQLQYLEATDKILILSEGYDYKLGSYKELAVGGVDFESLLRCYSAEESQQRNLSHESPRQSLMMLGGNLSNLEVQLHVSSIPDVRVHSQGQRGPRKTSNLSQSHGHLNFVKDDQIQSLLPNSLDYKRQLSLLEGEGRSLKTAQRTSSDGLHHRIKAVDEAASILSFGSMVSIDEMTEFVAPVHEEESRAGGTVTAKVYIDYFLAGKGLFGFIIFIFLNISAHVFYILTDWWLAFWCQSIENYDKYLNLPNPVNDSSTDSTLYNVTSTASMLSNVTSTASMLYNVTSGIPLGFPDNTKYLIIFTAVTFSVVIFAVVRAVHNFHILVMSSVNLHERMLHTILKCPIGFFDNNPIGRILNRFSKDIGQMDETLPLVLSDFLVCFLLCSGVILLVGIVNPWVFIPTLPLGVVFICLRRYYLRTTRNVKRMEATTKSPVFTHISTTVLGIQNIRAYRAQSIFVQEFNAHQDLHTSTYYLFLVLARWFAIRLELVSALFITSVTFCCVFAVQSMDGSMVGLSLTYAITLMGLFQWCVRQSSELENMMTTVERIIEYSQLESEAASVTPIDRKLPPNWPSAGRIVAEDVVLRYSPGGRPVLKGINFEIQPSEKIGIVGRTGAGKSSLITMLFRLVEHEGKLCIDGVDIATLGLNDVRKNISIIPQDPVLLSGTIRRNLDPVGQHSDAEIWKALKQVQLFSLVEEMGAGLDSKIQEGGANISMGQRQLICLARAILKSNKILVIDEATANVDPRTDSLIQGAIREQFARCTVLTIAHRLNTIIDSDRIMVLDDGEIAEFDTPHRLLQMHHGMFYLMAKQTGPVEFNRLCRAALEATLKVSDDQSELQSVFLTVLDKGKKEDLENGVA